MQAFGGLVTAFWARVALRDYELWDLWARAMLCSRGICSWMRLILLLRAGAIEPNPGPAVPKMRQRPPLPAQLRPPNTEETKLRRRQLLSVFESFIAPAKVVELVLDVHCTVEALLAYGKKLYEEGAAYSSFSELV